MNRSNVNPLEGSTSATSTDLLRQARANNQRVWGQLVEKFSRHRYRWCRREGLQPADVNNTVQEAFESVARKPADPLN